MVDVTNPKETFYINDRLVEEGHAQYPDQVIDKKTKSEPAKSIMQKILDIIPKAKH